MRVDGSGRVTIRNRKFLRKFVPVCPKTIRTPSVHAFPPLQQPRDVTPPAIANPTPEPVQEEQTPMVPTYRPSQVDPPSRPLVTDEPSEPICPVPSPVITSPVPSPIRNTSLTPTVIHRSIRQRKAPAYLADYEH